MKNLETQSNIRSSGHEWRQQLIHIAAIFLMFLFLAGCTTGNNQPQPPAQATSTPEQAWELYVQGWQKHNLDQVLSSCAPTRHSQERCQGQFQAVEAGGRFQEFAADLERATLTMERDLGTVRLYTFVVDDEASTVTFELFENLGWRVREF